MFRRKFLSIIPAKIYLVMSIPKYFDKISLTEKEQPIKLVNDRAYWVATLLKIADPVLRNLSTGTLKINMPIEVNPENNLDRSVPAQLEAISRLLAGMAPWLELGADDTKEGHQRAIYGDLARKCIAQAVNPDSPDYMRFTGGRYDQALVDTAFLAHALIRAPKELWMPLDELTKKRVIKAFKSSRVIMPGYNNWLLFMAMIETFLIKIGEEGDIVRMDLAVKKHMEWYKGDGAYGDSETFHWDYYNSFVIHPMMIDVAQTLVETNNITPAVYKTILTRGIRYAQIQERFISPEGTFPPIGRSLCYRFGALQALGQIALMKELPAPINPAQVRSALSAVIKRMIEAPGTFDKNGWLTVGFVGHQRAVAEIYISTGSLYLCSVGMLPLGLPATDPFWAAPAADWTAKKIWNGIDIPSDHSIA